MQYPLQKFLLSFQSEIALAWPPAKQRSHLDQFKENIFRYTGQFKIAQGAKLVCLSTEKQHILIEKFLFLAQKAMKHHCKL